MSVISRIRKFFRKKTLRELESELKQCPICGKRAMFVHYCGENDPQWWTVECSDVEDHGFYDLPGCNFHRGEALEYNVRRFSKPKSAMRYWNDVVVPIGIAAKMAMDRIEKMKNSKG